MTVYSSNGDKLYKSLDAPAYSIAEASRLSGIPRWTVGRYLRGYKYTYPTKEETRKGHQPPVVSQSDAGTTYASFLDLMDLLIVKELLERGFPLQRLRPILQEAREYLGTAHLVRSVFYTSPHKITLKLPEEGQMVALFSGGQGAIPEIIKRLDKKLDFESITEFGFAERWYPNGPDGGIVIDPEISFGRPTVIGYGTATNNIYDLFLGESKQIEPVSEWFNIPAPKIQTAVQFEHSLWT